MHLVKFFLCVAHLLDDTLHLTGVSKLALDELSLKRLFDLGCQTELVIHTLVLVQDSLHVGSLSALQVSCLQFHSSILHAFNTCIVMQISTSQEWIEIILRCCMHRSICILNFLLLSRRRIRLKTCHIMPDKSYHVSERPQLFCRKLEMLGEIHRGCLYLCSGMQTTTNSDLKSLDKLLQLLSLVLSIRDLILKKLEVPDLSIDFTFWAVPNLVSCMTLCQRSDHDSLSLSNTVHWSPLEKRCLI